MGHVGSAPGLERENRAASDFRLTKKGGAWHTPRLQSGGSLPGGRVTQSCLPCNPSSRCQAGEKTCLCHLTGSPEPTNKGKGRFPYVVVKDTDTQMHIWRCALVDPGAFRHRPLDSAGNAHAHSRGTSMPSCRDTTRYIHWRRHFLSRNLKGHTDI